MEKREFKLDRSILYSIIQKQAGTLEKAFLELVMNAIDAGSTMVEITLNAKTFTVKDDGKGFVSRDEIEMFFETFGTPHTEGDATYGKFRMGRGQVMAFSSNTWRSGEFQMQVDIKKDGLNYILDEGLVAEKGCTISGKLYEPLQPSSLMNVCRQLEDLCKYSSIPVMLNGNRISVDLEKEKWTFVDDNAYYSLRENSRTLAVYNIGVLVRHYPASDFGTGGLVISKKQLEVNFARNDVLQSECQIFRVIKKTIQGHVRLTEGKKERKTGTYKDLVASRLMAGDVAVDDAEPDKEFEKVIAEEKLFVDVCGAQYSAAQLCNSLGRFMNKLTVSPKEGDLKADKIQQGTMGLVLAPKTLARFGVQSFEELLGKLEKAAQVAQIRPSSSARKTLDKLKTCLVPFESLSGKIASDHKLVELTKLTKAEKLVFYAVRDSQWPITNGFNRAGHNRVNRQLRVGESETADAWTDGETYIAINRKLLSILGYNGQALIAFDKLGTILLHEYCHHTDDTGGHTHDEEFNQLYEEVSCGTGVVGEFINRALGEWLSAVKKESRKLRQGELKELDRYAIIHPEFEEDEAKAA